MDAGGVLCSSTQAVTSAGASNGDELLRVEKPVELGADERSSTGLTAGFL
jgi:hypothetical protein